jgi:hypothetical protein
MGQLIDIKKMQKASCELYVTFAQNNTIYCTWKIVKQNALEISDKYLRLDGNAKVRNQDAFVNTTWSFQWQKFRLEENKNKNIELTRKVHIDQKVLFFRMKHAHSRNILSMQSKR